MKIEAGLNDVSEFVTVSPGRYTFAIKEPMEITPIDGETTDIGGRAFKFIIFSEIIGSEAIEGKEFISQRIRRQFANKSKGSRYYLKLFLESIGVGVDKSGSFVSEEILGKTFSAEVSNRSYIDRNKETKMAAEVVTESIRKA